MSSISQILENNRVTGDYHTHVSMIHPKGKFQISKHVTESFWNSYCSDIFNEEKNQVKKKFQVHTKTKIVQTLINIESLINKG